MHIITDAIVRDTARLYDLTAFQEQINEILALVDVKNLGDVSHQFEGSGFTVTICLAESHIAIHTWPELGFVTFDVYLCNYLNDNTQKAEDIHLGICEYFDPISINSTRLMR